MVAYDYPLLGIFWSIAILFVWLLLLFLLFYILADIFRSHDMGGFAKALWVIFVILLPFLGVFAYLIARGSSMAARHPRGGQSFDPIDRYSSYASAGRR